MLMLLLVVMEELIEENVWNLVRSGAFGILRLSCLVRGAWLDSRAEEVAIVSLGVLQVLEDNA